MPSPIISLAHLRPTQRTPSILHPTSIDPIKTRRNALDLHLDFDSSQSTGTGHKFNSKSAMVMIRDLSAPVSATDAGTSTSISGSRFVDANDRDAFSRCMTQRLSLSGASNQINGPSLSFPLTASGLDGHHNKLNSHLDSINSPSRSTHLNNIPESKSLSELSLPDLDYSRRGSAWSIATDTTGIETPFDEDGSFEGLMGGKGGLPVSGLGCDLMMTGRKEWAFPTVAFADEGKGPEVEYRFSPLESVNIASTSTSEIPTKVEINNNDHIEVSTELKSGAITIKPELEHECKIVKPLSVTKPLRTRFIDELANYFSAHPSAISSSSSTSSSTYWPDISNSRRDALKLIGLLASTADQGSHLYADMTKKNCASLTKDLRSSLSLVVEGEDEAPGLLYEKRIVDGTFEAVKEEIERISRDGSVDGLIVYFPLFGIEKDAILRSLIPQHLDLEGLHPSHLSASYLSAPPRASKLTAIDSHPTDDSIKTPGQDSKLTLGAAGHHDKSPQGQDKEPNVYPCTPLAIMRFLEHVMQEKEADDGIGRKSEKGGWLRGKVCTVINRSEVVGRPLASFLANSGAIVHSIDHISSHVYTPYGLRQHSPDIFDNGTASTMSESGLYEIQVDGPTMDDALSNSDVVVSGVPVNSFKVPTKALKTGVVCLDFSTGDGNFEKDAESKASLLIPKIGPATILMLQQNAFLLRQRKERNNA